MVDWQYRVEKLGKRLDPARTMALLFCAVILAGAFALMLPMMHKQPLGFADALFTATSATCVTGLMTVNVAETFTTAGQVVILLLIQTGGLGIISVSIIFMLMLGRNVSMRDSAMLYGAYSSSHRIDIKKLLITVVGLVFALEAVGAVAMTALWYGEHDLQTAAYLGIFHAVSAFCNAGISILPEGLAGYDARPAFDLVFGILIATGVLGFMTILEVYERYRHKSWRTRRFSLQIKITVLYTAIFILLGTVGFFMFEYRNTLEGMPFWQKVVNSLFHSVSGRTAGFSNDHVGDFNNTTIYMFILFMFIGGAPGSVSGGIKLTTFAVLVGMAWSRYRGLAHVHIFNRAVPEEIVSRSISIIFISFSVVTLFMFLLLISEGHSQGMGGSSEHAQFLDIFFEVVSANGTVGLSMGVTSDLTPWGKLLVTLLMLIGRLGPLTVAMVVGTRDKNPAYRLSEENIMVG